MSGLLVLLLLLWIGSVPAHAVSRNLTLESLGVADLLVSAPRSSVVFDFPIPRLAKVRAASASIYITPGHQLSGETVFFFYYNDKLIETRTVKEIRQQKAVFLKVPVQGTFMDFARIKIKSGMFITDNLCRDYHSGGLYFTVHKNTSLNVSYDMPPARSVSDFFGSFQQSLLVVVPDSAKMEEYAPGAWIYALLKKTYPHLDIRLIRAAEIVGMPPVPRIWVGLQANLPGYFKGASSGIALIDSNTLLISADDVPNLRYFAQQLSELPTFSMEFSSNKRKVISSPEISAGNSREAVALENIDDQEGLLRVSTNFRIFPILLEKIPERMGIHLAGAYTASLDPARPVRMDVFLNSALVHSSVLDQSGRFERDIIFPEPLELRDRNDLNLQFKYPEEPDQCKARGHTQSARIFPDSYFWGDGQYRFNQFSWSNIGLFFARQGTVLLDETLGANALKIAGEIACFLNSRLPPGMAAFPNYIPLALQAEVPEAGFVLAAGSVDNMPALLQGKMPVSFGKDFSVYRKDTQKILFEHQANVSSVVGQVGEIKGVPLIVLSANKDAGILNSALRYLSRPANNDMPTGNIWIYQQQNHLYSFDIRDRSTKPEKLDSKMEFVELWEQNQTLIGIAAGILILSVSYILLFRRKNPRTMLKRKLERSNPSDKLFK